MIVFHAPSGDTHLLEPATGAALLLLREGPSDVPAMVRASGGGADVALLERLLAELEDLGVVERA